MTDDSKKVDAYIAARPAAVRKVLNALRAQVLAVLPDASEGMKWGAPTYSNAYGVPAIYLYGGRDHANMGFPRGVELKDPEKRLKGSGESGRHVKVFPGAKIPDEALGALIAQCADLMPGKCGD